MNSRPEDRGQRVTHLELFFDLVFVFAVTQVTSFLSHDPTWGGLLRGMLLFGILWWLWSAYAWLTNAFDAEEGAVRLAMFVAIGAMLVVSLAAPGAFGDDALIFATGYCVVRGIGLALYLIDSRGDPERFRAVTRILPSATVASVLLVVAGFLEGVAQVALWGTAFSVNFLGALIRQMRGWHVSFEHFVERFGLIIIIALGESIVAIGVGAAGLPLDAGLITAALLGVTVAACIWWSYFDWLIYVARARLAQATGTEQAAMARDMYTYLHLPMVAGIVLFAFGLKTAIADVEEPLGTIPALSLVGGIALYMLAHVALRLRISGGLGRGRPAAALVLLVMYPLVRVVPALVALGLVAAVCVALISYEVLRHREERTRIRERRESFRMEDVYPVPVPSHGDSHPEATGE